MSSSANVLIVDLNNFARYPTLAIGYLVAALRQAGLQVEVLSPLAHGAPPITRESTENLAEHIKRRVYFSGHPVMQRLHETLRNLYAGRAYQVHAHTMALLEARLRTDPPACLLLSAYLDHYPTVTAIAALAETYRVPVVVGGPGFTHAQTIADWLQVPGLTALCGGEGDFIVAPMVRSLLRGEDLLQYDGISTPASGPRPPARPACNLEQLPVPDFTDFPWERYPYRVIPMLAGRGCSWNVCTFCSDVTTSSGRTFRTRPLQAVLEEMREQSRRHQSSDYIFLDMKLNSDLEMWYGLIDNIQKYVPGARWIATVHVGARGENGLDLETLKAARASGLTRISFGLETGSQPLARRMGKGTTVEQNSQFVRDAWEAGLSVRASMMLGYPGETATDLLATREFLQTHLQQFDRIKPSRFNAIPGTRFEDLYQRRPGRFASLRVSHWDYRHARGHYQNTETSTPEYRRIQRDILALVHDINRKPMRTDARQFDGLM